MQRYLSNLLNFNNKKIIIKQNIVYQQKERITNYLSNEWYLCLNKVIINFIFIQDCKHCFDLFTFYISR